MTPGELIAGAALLLTVFAAIYRQGQLITALQEQVKRLPSAIKTERRLTRMETVLREIARVLNVAAPQPPEDDDEEQ